MGTGKPAPRNQFYAGVRAGGQCSVCWANDDATGDLDPRLDLRNHSPTGLEWGYQGSGPAQLALALVADATGDDELALRVYHQFKAQIIAAIDKDEWTMDAGTIADFANSLFVGAASLA